MFSSLNTTGGMNSARSLMLGMSKAATGGMMSVEDINRRIAKRIEFEIGLLPILVGFLAR